MTVLAIPVRAVAPGKVKLKAALLTGKITALFLRLSLSVPKIPVQRRADGIEARTEA